MDMFSEVSDTSNSVITWFQQLPPIWTTVIQMGFILLATIILSLIVWAVHTSIYNRLKKTHHLWDDILPYALHRPVQLAIWLIGLTFILQAIANLIPNFKYNEAFSVARDIVGIIAVVWFLMRYTKHFEQRIREEEEKQQQQQRKRRIDKATTFAISKLIRVGIAFIALLVVLQIIGVPISGLIAFGGAGAVVVGLAARDLLANFFGGLMIFTDRPFTVGDWVASPDRQIEGTVEHIGWRLTRIRTFDQRPLFVPNSVFSSVILVNPSRMFNRRITTTVGVRYDDVKEVPIIQKNINNMLRNHPEIDQNQTLFVRLSNFGASSLDIQVYTFTKTTNWLKFMEVQEDVLLKIAEIVHEQGAQFAFPSRTLEMPKGLSTGSLSECNKAKE